MPCLLRAERDRQWLDGCLRSIDRGLVTHAGLVTVIDDHSPLPPKGFERPAPGDAERLGRVDYRRNASTLGVAGNAYQALAVYGLPGTADFVCLPGHDDYLLPGYTDEIIRLFARHPGAVIAQPGVRLVDDLGRAASPSIGDRMKRWLRPGCGELGGEAAAALLMTGNFLYTPALAYRRTALRHVRRCDIPAVHDLATVVDILMQGGAIAFGGLPCFAYRRHRGSDSATRARDIVRITEEQRYFGRIATVFDDIGWHRAARAARCHVTARAHALVSAVANAKSGRLATAYRLTRRALTRV